MTALERAKRFVQKNAARTALVIVPLAMASSANAAPIVFDALTATVSAGGSGIFEALPSGGAQGVKFSSGAQTYFVSSGSGFTLTFTISGEGSGDLDGQTIPASYDFGYSFLNGTSVDVFNTSITFYIDFLPTSFASLPGSSSASGGSGLLGWVGPPTTDPWSWSVVVTAIGGPLSVDPNVGVGEIRLDVRSIELAPTDGGPSNTAVPEPSSLLLLTIGTALLVLCRRSRPTQR